MRRLWGMPRRWSKAPLCGRYGAVYGAFRVREALSTAPGVGPRNGDDGEPPPLIGLRAWRSKDGTPSDIDNAREVLFLDQLRRAGMARARRRRGRAHRQNHRRHLRPGLRPGSHPDGRYDLQPEWQISEAAAVAQAWMAWSRRNPMRPSSRLADHGTSGDGDGVDLNQELGA
jgi:hypothetical protein